MASVTFLPTQALLHAALLIIAISFLIASPPAATAARGAAKPPRPPATTLQFYMHDRPGDTAVRVAPATPLNFSGDPSGGVAAMFGSVYVMDNPLTAAPGANSTLLGRAQGIYAMASREDEFGLLMVLTYSFVRGPFNGSSFSVVGRNPIQQPVREMPIVGGTGAFRLARGYCMARTQAADGMDAVVAYNATIFHLHH
ncbi:hypothetical protein Taro_024245 [Colocasia esculenta]|uniref:Dirigent protein n=1 Tax=Colocasia esculenta TaxID=4460 RepID=A0A843VGW2_COLES|nr:hypothetical protein [Colocasia esculenta]